MKKLIATVLSVAALSAAYGDGTIATLSNNSGSVIYPIFAPDGTTKLAGTDYKVEVFTYNAANQNGFGVMLGAAVSPAANFRFNAGSNAAVPGTNPGGTADLIVRAWDTRTGATYDEATIRGSSGKFTSDTLGGDPDGDGPLLPITPKSMATGAANGFQSFSITTEFVPEPTTIALGALGAAALFIRRRK
jgi:WD40 repeat protein